MNWNNASRAFSERGLGCVAVPALCCLVLAAALWAQAPAPVVTLHSAHASAAKAKLEFQIAPGFHIQSNHPNSAFLIPTTIEFATHAGVRVIAIHWPPAEQVKFSFSPTPLAVFSGKLPVTVTLHSSAHAARMLKGTLRYQACNATLCRPPASLPFTLTVP